MRHAIEVLKQLEIALFEGYSKSESQISSLPVDIKPQFISAKIISESEIRTRRRDDSDEILELKKTCFAAAQWTPEKERRR